MRVLFLDIDGVLHPDPLQIMIGRTLRGKPVARARKVEWPCIWVGLLAEMLAGIDDIEVVIHSSWRLAYTLEELRLALGPIGERIVGATEGAQRWMSIQAWVAANPLIKDYLILDNASVEFPVPAPAQLLLCPSDAGLSDPQVQDRLRRWLRAGSRDLG